jgi:hypothetical protein
MVTRFDAAGGAVENHFRHMAAGTFPIGFK